MSQPKWRCIANLGDASPVDFGGYFVFIDETGVYAPEVELWEPPCDDSDETGPITAYRWTLEPHTFVGGVLSDNPYHPDHAVWYAQDLESMADCFDTTAADLIAGFCSADPIERAQAYRAVQEYSGAYELDQYPRTVDRTDAERISDAWLAEIDSEPNP